MKVFLDTETTDLKTDRGGVIWQLGYIIEYDNGEILEHGSHDELIKFGGLYARLFVLQVESYKGIS